MIKHILKDGTVLQDIAGHVVKQSDAPLVYQIMEQKNRKGGRKKDGNICGHQESK